MDERQLYVMAGSIALIALTVLANYLIGGYRLVRLTDAAAALDRLRQDFPDFRAGDVTFSDDQMVALIAPAGGDAVGLVSVLGDNMVTRLLRPDDVAGARLVDAAPGAATLILSLNDLALPEVRLVAADGAALAAWQTRLVALQPRAEAA